MILRSQERFDTIEDAIQALRDARDVLGRVIDAVENTLDQEDYKRPTFTKRVDLTDVDWSYTGEGGQGDYLPRSRVRRDDEVRYHRGSKASDERPLRQQWDTYSGT